MEKGSHIPLFMQPNINTYYIDIIIVFIFIYLS